MKSSGSSSDSHMTPAHTSKGHYRRLLIMTAISFVAMFVLMYAMVNVVSNANPNLNQFYMAGLMTAAMLIIELALMGGMYPDKKRNAVIVGIGIAALVVFWVFIRRQTGIGDQQFLRSMVPHHAGAVLMCQQASITDAEIRLLCQDIVSGQEEQIEQMKAKLQALKK
jgi:hypothetical protein